MNNYLPLALRLRPKKINEFIGQKKLTDKDSWFYQALKTDHLPSLVFWGPPGSGKTSLAHIIAKETKAEFIELSAVSSGLKDLKPIIERAQTNLRLKLKTILFIDEIHRWNKAQQDALLPQIENGVLILIGATTENPSFALNNALLSRLRVISLDPLDLEDLNLIIKRAIKLLDLNLNSKQIKLIANLASGDARRALGILEILNEQPAQLSDQLIKEVADQGSFLYDKGGDERYHLISALHKSMRGSNSDAAVYYLNRILLAGEDPLYLARRLIRFASEDVGLANNSALLLAVATYEACKYIGLPECGVNLSHCVIYLSKSKKSILAYEAHNEAIKEIKDSGSLPVPLHLRNAPTQLMKDLSYGKDYKYSPKEDDSQQEYLPEKLRGRRFLKK